MLERLLLHLGRDKGADYTLEVISITMRWRFCRTSLVRHGLTRAVGRFKTGKALVTLLKEVHAKRKQIKKNYKTCD